MSFIELDSVLFRGELKGAKGTAKFRLTAQAIDAVDTVNIGNGQCTYDFKTQFGVSHAAGVALFTAVLDIPDATAWVEIIAYATRAVSIYVDSAKQPIRNRRPPNSRLLPSVSLHNLSQGTHTVQIFSGSAGWSDGYIMCRYIRTTGVA